MTRRPGSTRRAGVYVVVLSSATLVTTISLGSLLAVRAQSSAGAAERDVAQARLIAGSAIELGLMAIGRRHDWRTALPHGPWASGVPLGTGTYTLGVMDPTDGDLADSNFDPLVMTAVGMHGAAQYFLSVRLAPPTQPLDLLRTAAHAEGSILVSSAAVTASGGPLSTNGNAQISSTLMGDLEAGSVSGGGSVSGKASVPADAKTAPPATVLTDYSSGATLIVPGVTIERTVLGPGVNPWGSPNANGAYRITSSSDLTIRNMRLHGTLIIRAPGRTVTIEGTVLMQPYRSDYPTLMIDAARVELNFDSRARLSEYALTVNFNPSTLPYLGASDGDSIDLYPSEIQGLIHVVGDVRIRGPARTRGVLFCSGTLEIEAAAHLICDARFLASPPAGYTEAGPMRADPGSWTRVVLP